MKLTENLKNVCTYLYICVNMCTCVHICIWSMCRYMYKCIWIWTVYSFICMCVRHEYKYARYHAYIYRSICLYNWHKGLYVYPSSLAFLRLRVMRIPSCSTIPTHLFCLKPLSFWDFSHTGMEYPKHLAIVLESQLHIYHTIKLITFSFIQITQHEHFPTCHTAEHSYCFIAIYHYRYDGLYCQCSPRVRYTLTIYFALYCFFHLKQVIQNLFFLVNKYTLAISLNDFMWIKTQVLLAWKNFSCIIFSWLKELSSITKFYVDIFSTLQIYIQ